MTGATRPRAIAIVGPTASGKTALAVEIARRLDGEVISMDSRQVYRGMDIGTAKASAAQRAAIPHHGLDLVEPSERYSAGRFARAARAWINDIEARGRVPVLAGGTGFFLRALTSPIFQEPVLDPRRREALRTYLSALDAERLRSWLAQIDPGTAERLASGGGMQRVLRALEMALLTGRSLSWWHRNAPAEAPPVPMCIFVLDPPRELLRQRIDRRVDAMLEAGLLDEVRSLVERGFGAGDPGMNATGYAELLPVLSGDTTLAAAAESIRRSTRAYARRQRTWFRHQLPEDAVWLEPEAEIGATVERIERAWRSAIGQGGASAMQDAASSHQPSSGRSTA